MIYKTSRSDGAGRRFYAVKFHFRGKVIHKRTRATSARDARAIEAQMRSELERGNFGILKPRPMLTVREFLVGHFRPFVRSKFAKKSTLRYYADGVRGLLDSDLAGLPLAEVTDQHAGQYAARRDHLSPSTVNCGLRTLRRALHLAVDWGKLDRMPKLTLVKGERQRERVLTDAEISAYLAACPQPWKDCATILLGTGVRPSECFSLRWEAVYLNGDGGMIQITQGKSRAARRILPMVPAVYDVIRRRHEEAKRPVSGWVFPSGSKSHHLERDSAKNQHQWAFAQLAAQAKKNNTAAMRKFCPYTMRHTALTRLAAAGCDAFTLARIAGHSSILITQRYCHPQADAIEKAFSEVAKLPQVVTTPGHHATVSGERESHVTVSE